MRRTIVCLPLILLACGVENHDIAADRDVAAAWTDVIVVGAGIAGLSAALEAARGGARVTVIDMNSQGAGHAILANGFAIVDTPLQRRRGYRDSPEQAYAAWLAYSPDGDRSWMRFYANNSRELIYDWVTELGVRFDGLAFDFANRDVPRFHNTEAGAADVVLRIYRETLRHSNVDFRMNTEVTELSWDGSRVTGVRFRDLRSGATGALNGAAVVLATGGFERNLDKVLQHWPVEEPRPQRLLTSAGEFARGSGLELASRAGAMLTNLDKRYVYTYGLPDPRGSGNAQRSIGFTNPRGIWVNGQGRRFVNVYATDKDIYAAVMRQEPAGFWIVFDRDGIDAIRPRDIRYRRDPRKYRREVLDNPELVKKAASIFELAREAGLPAENLAGTVARYNEFVARGIDDDFGRFPTDVSLNSTQRLEIPDLLNRPPYYAVRIFPNAVKSMGGVAIELDTRVLRDGGGTIPGLYAAGEVTGSAGINGSYGLNGMFLGPALMTGRLAGQAALRALSASPAWRPAEYTLDAQPAPGRAPADLTMSAADLRRVVEASRPGYWHFEASHELVLERGQACGACHSAVMPQRQALDNGERLAQLLSCRVCH